MSPVPAHSRLDKQLTATAEAFDSEWTLYMFVSGMKAIRSMAFGDVFGGPEKRDVIYVCEPRGEHRRLSINGQTGARV